ncbi:MAG: Holliday junction branch migration protein RuvA [Ruminococcaceae bacterium]|nr:Holliday junction branch migration protein RuvA [Oscillospiraceae bacterium]
MIYSLNGGLIHLDALTSSAVIECGGVGYKVTVTSGTLARLPSVMEPPHKVRIFTHMQVREDAVELYGFATEEELTMFKMLITVSGVGPKAAISILSLFTPQKLALAIAEEDAKAISKAPNVGAKTAGRIILDLKSKLAKEFPLSGGTFETGDAVPTAEGDKGKLADAQDALLVLGYSRAEVNAALKKVDTEKPLEDIIRRALAVLMKQ